MDGAQLLEEVAGRHPDVVRLVLSGQADKRSVERAMSTMHQYLSKPCEASVLRTTIDLSCRLRKTLQAISSHELICGVHTLPSLPDLYQEVVAEIESEEGTVARVGEIVSKDIAMTAKILQLANSAMFGLRSAVRDTAHAASLLGLDTLKSLVLSLQVFKSFEGTAVPGFSIRDLMDHSFRVATIGQSICRAERLDKDLTNEAFTAGLLHDVGKLILAENAAEGFVNAIELARTEEISQVAAERHEFGLGHDGIGGYLLSLWGLPQSIVEAVAFHHQPQSLHGPKLNAAMVTYVANVLAHEELGAEGGETQECTELLASVGKLDRIDVWRQAITQNEGD